MLELWRNPLTGLIFLMEKMHDFYSSADRGRRGARWLGRIDFSIFAQKCKWLTRLFLRVMKDADDSGYGWGESVKNHKRVLADDKLSVRSGFQLAAYLRVFCYLQYGFVNFIANSGGGGCSCCFDVVLGNAPQVAMG